MIKKINTFDNPVLYKKTVPITPTPPSLTGAMKKNPTPWPDEINQLALDLVETCESMAENCLGLAAPQIWDKDTPCPRMFCMRWPVDPSIKSERGWEWQIILNPVIKTTGKTIKWDEGCLSLPNKTFKKARGKNVVMVFQYMNKIEPVSMKFFGKDSIIPYVIQHEVAHLDGTLISNKYKRK